MYTMNIIGKRRLTATRTLIICWPRMKMRSRNKKQKVRKTTEINTICGVMKKLEHSEENHIHHAIEMSGNEAYKDLNKEDRGNVYPTYEQYKCSCIHTMNIH